MDRFARHLRVTVILAAGNLALTLATLVMLLRLLCRPSL